VVAFVRIDVVPHVGADWAHERFRKIPFASEKRVFQHNRRKAEIELVSKAEQFSFRLLELPKTCS